MENNEKYRGQTDSIILFILSKGVRHADELKIIIDEYFTGVKIGTLYSIISRLKNQHLISEYRASSIDGSRRKYFQLTPKGVNYFEENFSKLFEGANIEFNKVDYTCESNEAKAELEAEPTLQATAEEAQSPASQQEQISTESAQQSSLYSQMINSTVLDNNYTAEIDFSSLEADKEAKSDDEQPQIDKSVVLDNEPVNKNKELFSTKDENYKDESFISYEIENVSQEKPQDDVNLDSVLNPTYEYSSVLSKLFPKKHQEVAEAVEEIETQDITDEVTVKEFSENGANWNEVYDLAEKEGIKIRTSSDTNRYQGSKILLSRLLLFSSLVILAFSLIEYALLTAIIPNVKFNAQQFLVIACVFGSVALIALINFLVNPFMQVKNLPKFINVFEIALIITISTAIISFALAAIKEIDYLNNQALFDSLILPIAVAFNLIVFSILTYLLSKSEHFEVI